MARNQPPNTNRGIMPTPHDGGVTAPLNRRYTSCAPGSAREGAANGHYGGLKGPRPALGWI